ncbi:MAG: DUF3786 domain-containing protein [Nitrospirae bacterium]|nr:DUF3786 domain-containing protein [Nitrospirota bacterium]NTW65107.1 DUF3786 domain-containing protein [Nitrospirota bacterium]
MKKALEHISFPALAERINALYNDVDDALLLAMLGQEYVINRTGITLRGQKAPDTHEAVILDYLSSTGNECIELPWRALKELTDLSVTDFHKRVELPLMQHVSEIIGRANTLLPLFDGFLSPSIIGSDLAITVRALPKVTLHVEMSREDKEFPPEVWVLFSNNADQFLRGEKLQLLAELFKDRLLSLLRIY